MVMHLGSNTKYLYNYKLFIGCFFFLCQQYSDYDINVDVQKVSYAFIYLSVGIFRKLLPQSWKY